jgi:predicted lipoprotein with Yx(FWY)xxD motif/plastocyanin
MKQRVEGGFRPGSFRMSAVLIGLSILALVIGGCAAPAGAPASAPAAAPAQAQPASAPAAPAATTMPTTMPEPTMAATTMPAATAAATTVATTAVAATAIAATPPMTSTAAGGPPMLQVAENGTLGQFLVDNKGMSLYLYTKDTKNTSNCYDKCAAAWPPLYTDGAPQAGAGVDASLLGTTTRKDGKVQVTYNGWPLYYWAKDQKPGDVTGQDVGGVWYVISPKGEEIKTKTAAATPAATGAAAPAATTQPAAAGQTVNVTIKDFKFGSGPLTVAPGTTVIWTNTDAAPHTVTADDKSFDSGNLNTGATFKYTFTKAGTYPYYCLYHGGPGGSGMSSTIIVK